MNHERGLEAAERVVSALINSGDDYSDSDLVNTAIDAYLAATGHEAADRIEALERALREVLDITDEYILAARAALKGE